MTVIRRFLRVLTGTRSPAHGVVDHEDDPAGDQRGDHQHHRRAGHARAPQHVSRTRRVLHLRAACCDGRNSQAGTYLSSREHTRDIQRGVPHTLRAHTRLLRERDARIRACARARAFTRSPVSGRESRAEKSPMGGEAAAATMVAAVHHATHTFDRENGEARNPE